MANYQYRGRNEQGQLVSGQLEGASREVIASQLLARGVSPLAIDESTSELTLSERWHRWQTGGKVAPTDLIMFCRQMYTITKAGIPLLSGVRGLAASLSHYRFQTVLNEIAERLESGVELSTAMGNYPDIFDKLFVSLVHVGENTGKLDEAFEQLSQYLERDLETRKRIKSALRYPSFVLAALVIAMAVVNIFVIPAFADMFAQFDAELPLPTRILLATSSAFVNYWHYMLGVACVGVYSLISYVKTDLGSRAWGRVKLRIPLVGDIINRGSMARYARSFGLMLRSGVPLVQALNLCARVIDNSYLSDKILAIREGIERGESLFQTHNHSRMFTPLVLQMISVGEESGQVDSLLTEVAEFYEREVDYDLKSLSDKIEPIMIVIMAVFVMILALGIFLPMWNMAAVQGG